MHRTQPHGLRTGPRLMLALGLCAALTARAEERAAVAITQGPSAHLFASYYGITSWNPSQRYVSVLRTEVQNRLPTQDDPATLGLVDMHDGYGFLPLTETRAWNFQQGCMAHWLSDTRLVFNDLVDGRFVAVVYDIVTRERVRTWPHPVSAVAADGRTAVSINFARLRATRPDYGYGGGGQQARAGVVFPEDDGLWRVDLETGAAELLVRLADIRDLMPALRDQQIAYFNHTVFSRDGQRVFWLVRTAPFQRNTTPLVVNIAGGELTQTMPARWGASHFDWHPDGRLMVTARYERRHWRHLLFSPGSDTYTPLAPEVLDFDGHGCFSPDGKWMVTDTYPQGPQALQTLYRMDVATEDVQTLGAWPHPETYNENRRVARCDLHPRFSQDGAWLGINSAHTGTRQCYVLRLE